MIDLENRLMIATGKDESMGQLWSWGAHVHTRY